MDENESQKVVSVKEIALDDARTTPRPRHCVEQFLQYSQSPKIPAACNVQQKSTSQLLNRVSLLNQEIHHRHVEHVAELASTVGNKRPRETPMDDRRSSEGRRLREPMTNRSPNVELDASSTFIEKVNSPSPASPSSSPQSQELRKLSSFQRISCSLLLQQVISEASNPERITAPTLFVAATMKNDLHSFSAAIKSCGKFLMDEGNPDDAADRIECLYVLWKDNAFSLEKAEALLFLGRVLQQSSASRVDVVTFFSSALLVPLIQLFQIRFPCCINDIRTMAWMLQPSESWVDIDRTILSFLRSSTFLSHPIATSTGLAHRLAALPLLYKYLCTQLGSQGMLQSFLKVERHIQLLCCRMKVTGFPVDPTSLQAAYEQAQKDMASLKEQAQSFTKGSFNIQSTDDCRRVLFSELELDRNLAELSSTKGGKVSTNEETLKQLSAFHSLPGIIMQYRKYAKLCQTYMESLMTYAVPSSRWDFKLIHTNFLPEGTDTGRLACAEPNLQNLPNASNDVMGCIRNAFRPFPNHQLVAIDYEQIELRVLAHLCSDVALLEALCNEKSEMADIHRHIASLVLGKQKHLVTTEERSRAKRAVFGVIYGIGPKMLAQQINDSFDAALRLLSQLKNAFPQIDRYATAVVADCRKSGLVKTILGRQRHLPDINSGNMNSRALAERQAFNTVIQGSAADIVKRAMIETEKVLQEFPECQLLSQIHDELILSIPSKQLTEVVPRVKGAMETAMPLTVPLRVKILVGGSLGSLQPYVLPGENRIVE